MFAVERLISLVAVHNCVSCGREGSLVCQWCLPDAFPAVPDRCYVCYQLMRDAATCTGCRKSKSRPANTWVVTSYGGLAKDLISVFKFKRARVAAQLIAQHLDVRIPFLDEHTTVVHIPTATRRRRQRGYDQSELIAKEFAKLRGLNHVGLLARTGQSRQVGMNRKQRISQMQFAFRTTHRAFDTKHPILLVDDLITTGASIESATKTLKDAGCKRVYAAAFAQK